MRLSSKAQLERSMAAAPWKLGAVRLAPRLYLRDISYQDNVFGESDAGNQVSDFRATLGGGLTGYLNIGPKVIASAFTLPEYNYWLDEDGLRRFTGNHGVGVFGYFNRLTVTFDATRTEVERALNVEVEAPVGVRADGASLQLELEAATRLTVFARAAVSQVRHRSEADRRVRGLDLAGLDRDESVLRVGARYDRSQRWSVGLGLEDSETDFEDPTDPRSSTGSSPFLTIGVAGNKLQGTLDVVARSLEFQDRSRDYDSLTGQVQLQHSLGRRTSLTGYGARNLIYSGLEGDALFTETRWGLSAGMRLSERADVGAFAELGTADYEAAAADGTRRRDDLEAFGASLRFDLWQGTRRGATYDVRLTFGYSETRVRSNLPGFDRSSRALTSEIALRFGANLLPW